MSKHTDIRLSKTLPAAFGLVLALGGCFQASDESPAAMSAADYDEVAAALSTLVLDETQASAFGGAAQLAQGIVPADFEVKGELALAERGGREYSLSAVCSDALGRGALCGDDATMAYVAATWTGETSDFDTDWTRVDLGQDTLVLSGSAKATAEIGAKASSSGWRLDYLASFDDVGIDAVSGRAVAGQVFYDLTVERRVDNTSERVPVAGHMILAADGSATLTLDGHAYHTTRDGSLARN